MDTDRLRELVPHYVAMLILVYIVLGALRATVGDQGFWIELVIIVVLVSLYRPVVMRLGVGPSAWEE